MSSVIESAEDLFDILAGDDHEVPDTLIRSGKRKSRHEEALIEQEKLEQLNKVERWMKKEESLQADPAGFFSIGEMLIDTILKGEIQDYSVAMVQKLTKLVNVFMNASKACKLLEAQIQADHVAHLLHELKRRKSLSAAIQEECGRYLRAYIQASPSRLFVDPEVIKSFNEFIASWCKGSFRGNGFAILTNFPIEFLAQLTWPLSTKAFVAEKVNALVVRIMKSKLTPKIDQSAYVSTIRSLEDSKHKKEVESIFLKLVLAMIRSKSMIISDEVKIWAQEVSERDTSKPGVSLANVRLAKDVLRQLA